MATDTVRFQLVLPRWLRDEVLQASSEKGISMSEFIKDSLKYTLEREKNQNQTPD